MEDIENTLQQELIKKHVILAMSNGFVLEGFIDECRKFDGQGYFLVLFENNNNKVLVRMDDISFSRILRDNTRENQEIRNKHPTQIDTNYKNIYGLRSEEKVQQQINDEEYSLPLPTVEGNPIIRKPQLNRSRR